MEALVPVQRHLAAALCSLPLALLVPPLSTAHVRVHGGKACLCQSPAILLLPKVPWRSSKTNDVHDCRSIFYVSRSK